MSAKETLTISNPKARLTEIRLTQIRSPIGKKRDQRQTLIGLGLNKMHRTITLENTPAVKGMIDKVKHLVKVEVIN